MYNRINKQLKSYNNDCKIEINIKNYLLDKMKCCNKFFSINNFKIEIKIYEKMVS